MQQTTALVNGKIKTFSVIAGDESLEGKIEVLMDIRTQGKYFVVLVNDVDVLYHGYNYTRVRQLAYNAGLIID